MDLIGMLQAAAGGAETVPKIGDPYEGGFFTGKIWSSSELYRVVVAPKATGESTTNLRYKDANTAAPAATRTLNNGPAATAAMVADGSSTVYPAAHFCNDLTIGGFSDWYLPARDELELCYRNLKPTTGSNAITSRATSSIVYPEGNDVSADTHGVNRNSDPTGAAYTSGNPAQTSVSSFQLGNTEAFNNSTNYWSSTEFSDSNAWDQDSPNGAQVSRSKSISFRRVRAVRRVRISPAIGEFFEGGYYAGAIVIGGVQYYIIVAPKATGESAGFLQWKNSNTAAPAAAQTLNNGLAATAAMVADGNATVYPAAHFCNDLTINGFSDWYLPARDELELCYRNLKPTTGANSTTTRSKSSIAYPQGDDVSGDIQGRNRNTPSTFMGYNSANAPVQTNVALFQSGGSEDLASAIFWSSTEFSAAGAWFQSAQNGSQGGGDKNGSQRVRAVRRVPVPTDI